MDATLVAVAVVEHDGQFLVGIRPPGVPLAGFAEFPGGKVLLGESPEAAAVRECFEESGIVVDTDGAYLSVKHQYDHGLLHIHFIRCRLRDSSGGNQHPKTGFGWVDATELSRLKFPAANAKLIGILRMASSAG